MKFDLPAQIFVYLMHDNDSLYVCAKGKIEDYTVIDIYTRYQSRCMVMGIYRER